MEKLTVIEFYEWSIEKINYVMTLYWGDSLRTL